MKNKLFFFVAVFSLFFSFTFPVFADDFPVSVYGAPGEQRQVMECIEKSESIAVTLTNEGYHIAEKSIMPIYGADLINFSREGVFQIKRWENVYVAQYETKDNIFAGIVYLRIENGNVWIRNILTSKEIQETTLPDSLLNAGRTFCAPCSYSFHKEFIRNTFGENITEENVCYLVLESEGPGFYVKGKNGNPDAIFSSYIDFQGNIKRSVLWIDDKLKTYADEKREAYEKELAEIEAWKAEHPGEDYPLPDGGVWEAMLQNKEKRSVLFPIIGASVFAGAGILAVILLAAKKRKRAS